MSTMPWTTTYPTGLRWDAEIPLRAVDLILDDAVARWPDRAAVDFMGRRISYSELGQVVGQAAKGVQAQSRALNLPVAVWQDGKLVEKPA